MPSQTYHRYWKVDTKFIIPPLFFASYNTVSAYGQEWESAEIHNVKTPYKTFFNKEIIADIGVKIGLNSVNITLKGKKRILFDFQMSTRINNKKYGIT